MSDGHAGTLEQVKRGFRFTVCQRYGGPYLECQVAPQPDAIARLFGKTDNGALSQPVRLLLLGAAPQDHPVRADNARRDSSPPRGRA